MYTPKYHKRFHGNNTKTIFFIVAWRTHESRDGSLKKDRQRLTPCKKICNWIAVEPKGQVGLGRSWRAGVKEKCWTGRRRVIRIRIAGRKSTGTVNTNIVTITTGVTLTIKTHFSSQQVGSIALPILNYSSPWLFCPEIRALGRVGCWQHRFQGGLLWTCSGFTGWFANQRLAL